MYNLADTLYISLIIEAKLDIMEYLAYYKNQSDLVCHALMPKMFFTFIIIINVLFIVNIYRMILIEFNTAINVTPTSAKTAAHIFVKPNTTNNITPIFIVNANIIFCHNILLVLFDILIASDIDSILSLIKTTSAASIAASDPIPPHSNTYIGPC